MAQNILLEIKSTEDSCDKKIQKSIADKEERLKAAKVASLQKHQKWKDQLDDEYDAKLEKYQKDLGKSKEKVLAAFVSEAEKLERDASSKLPQASELLFKEVMINALAEKRTAGNKE
ncbi:hypothetical protein HYW21_08790 [Candidatus Woesearchaeota archaeon]|nr:hypothetical protein [Candidatus Woesearchaeota archaeon]